AGSITNVATDRGVGPGNTTVSASRSEERRVGQTPTIALAKTDGGIVDANHDGKVDAGDTGTYSYTVSNTGNVTLTGLTVTDNNGTPGNTLDDVTITNLGTTTLAPDTSTTGTYTRTLSQSDIDAGSITNVATDRGVGPGNTTVSASEIGRASCRERV